MEIKFTIFNKTSNWVKGKTGDYKFEAKLYDVGSEYGIDGGRVSKLIISKNKKWLVNYDRGWDIKPEGKLKELFIKVLNFLEKAPQRWE